MEKGRISAFQMAIMMYPMVVGTGIIFIPGITAKYAKHDMWLSPIWASFIGFLAVLIAFQLHKMYPRQTIIQYSEHIIGRIPGKVLGFVFLFFYIQMNAGGVRIYADFIAGTFFSQTPLIVIISTMILVCGFAVRGGIEVVGRSAQLFIPLYVAFLMIIIILLLPELDPKNIFPIMENGVMPTIKGAITPQSWFAEFLLISFLLPFLTDVEKGRKWGIISVFIVMLTFVATNLVTLFLLGEITASFTYPLLAASRYISIAGFLQHLESVVMAIWVAGTFIKFSVVYYAIALATAQWLDLSDYRPIVFPLGFLTLLLSIWGVSSEIESAHYNSIIFPFFSLIVQTLIPILLLLIAVLRKRNRPKKE
ncbi:spore gernimation protein [Virgibacillus necropolis]|uniref:Spore gernimation protein n=1 Tax=Virgibacillus necropolis TaxID=163877 RepID=A0A221MI98_9BACI|nr:spore gernimation protein [Virgibacillus necropolis]